MNGTDEDIEKSLDDYRHGRFKRGTIEELLKDLNDGEE